MKLTLLKAAANDLDVVNAARVSFGKRSETLTEADEKLISYLLRNGHGTPFEHGYFQFHVEAPIFVFREWHRHRIGHSYNEISGRYVELPAQFYRPKDIRRQVGKPGHYTFEHIFSLKVMHQIVDAQHAAWKEYIKLLELGVAKEQARAVLPLGIYSEMYASCNPRSLMHFLGLRTQPDALEEIRELAQQAEACFAEVMPVTYNAWKGLQ